MEEGKLTNHTLQKILFDKINIKNKEVLIGAGIGKDTALLNFEEDLFSISTDPITGSKNGIGRLCVNISCNDIATSMATPVAMMVTILIPTYANIEDVEEIIDEMVSTSSLKNYVRIIDREQAIMYALKNAKKDDIILIAGKGKDTYMAIKDKYIPYSDYEVVEKYINSVNKSK